jgi:hypothetical protein
LNDEQLRVVRTAFPHGCSLRQFQCLMQAVTTAERLGVPHAYLERALAWDSPDMTPWKMLEHHVERLRKDASEAAWMFDKPLRDIRAYLRFIAADSSINDPQVRSWVRGDGDRRRRANALADALRHGPPADAAKGPGRCADAPGQAAAADSPAQGAPGSLQSAAACAQAPAPPASPADAAAPGPSIRGAPAQSAQGAPGSLQSAAACAQPPAPPAAR